MGTEIITYSRIGKEDIRFGTGTFEVVLADGRKVTLSEVNLGAILGDTSISKLVALNIEQEVAGTPQLTLTGAVQGSATLRCGGSGSDDGDVYLKPTGSTVWLQSTTDTYRLTLELVPKGTVTHAPATMEMYGTDFIADGTNYERLSLRTKGTTDSYHEISSEKGGSGTVRSLLISAGSNHLYLDATTGAVGTGTQTVTGGSPGQIVYAGIAYASLGTPVNGTLSYCSDCTIANPCASGGTGAFAKRLNGVWVCN